MGDGIVVVVILVNEHGGANDTPRMDEEMDVCTFRFANVALSKTPQTQKDPLTCLTQPAILHITMYLTEVYIYLYLPRVPRFGRASLRGRSCDLQLVTLSERSRCSGSTKKHIPQAHIGRNLPYASLFLHTFTTLPHSFGSRLLPLPLSYPYPPLTLRSSVPGLPHLEHV